MLIVPIYKPATVDLPRVSEMRYFGIFVVKARSFSHSKRSFFGVVNGVFGKLLNLASEMVILELVKSKCLPILLYGLECCNLRSADRIYTRWTSHTIDYL